MREMFALSEYFDVNEAEFYKTPPDFNPHNLDLDEVIAVFVDSSVGYAADISNPDRPSAGWYWSDGMLQPLTDCGPPTRPHPAPGHPPAALRVNQVVTEP